MISVVLFCLIYMGFGSFSNFSPQGSFSLASVSEIIKGQDGQNLIFGSVEKSLPDSPELLLIENSTLKSASPPTSFSPQILGVLVSGGELEDTKKLIAEHIVEPGESLWSIAERFSISIETIVWANDLKSLVVWPGQKLLILPVSGVMHLVKEGETVGAISQNYKAEAEEVISFNDLSGDADIFSGEVLIVPGGKLPLLSIVRQPEAPSSSGLSTNNFNGQSHAFPYGQCTWWVAQKRAIGTWGNANQWMINALEEGFTICQGSSCIPQKGAVVVLLGNRTYGHVGYVEDIKGDKVVFSEMNYIGWGKMNYRTLRIGSPAIIGYIY